MQTELNVVYLNSIEVTSKSYIDQSHVWNLGGHDYISGTRADFYSKERGATVYTGNPVSWTGAIALMYPSDWAYASSGASSICENIPLWSWNNQLICYNNSWLYNSSYQQWALTPHSANSYSVSDALMDGLVSSAEANFTLAVRPVLYLKSSVKITGGSGTSTDPFILGA